MYFNISKFIGGSVPINSLALSIFAIASNPKQNNNNIYLNEKKM